LLANLAIGAIFIVFPSGTEYEKIEDNCYRCAKDDWEATAEEIAENHSYSSVPELERHIQVKL